MKLKCLVADLCCIILIFLSSSNSSFSSVMDKSSLKQNNGFEPLSKWSRRWLNEVVPHIITQEERDFFNSLPTEEKREKFIEFFWMVRDPDPNTPENEFKIELFQRIKAADKLFRDSGLPGSCSERGRAYILFGPPTQIWQEFEPAISTSLFDGGTAFSIHEARERWLYLGNPNPSLPGYFELAFANKFTSGKFEMASELSDHECIVAVKKSQLKNINKLWKIYTTFQPYDPIPIEFKAYCLKGPEKRTVFPFCIKIPYSELAKTQVKQEYHFTFTFVITVINSQNRIICDHSQEVTLKYDALNLENSMDNKIYYPRSLILDPGTYKFRIYIIDKHSRKIGFLYCKYQVPKFDPDELDMSDIILSGDKAAAGNNTFQIEEMSSATREFQSEKDMNACFEVYNLSVDPNSGVCNLDVEYSFVKKSRTLIKIKFPHQKPSAERDRQLKICFKLRNFTPGEYILQIKATDLNSGNKITRKTNFHVIP